MLVGSILIVHQLIFQGMFFVKNLILKKKLGREIRGKNREAQAFIAFVIFFVGAALTFYITDTPIGQIHWVQWPGPLYLALPCLLGSLVVSAMSLVKLGDSWRVGVIEKEQTALITTGIYGYSRNPYFFSYLLMFVGYSVLLQNGFLIFLAMIGFSIMHWMIKKEESYLKTVHGKEYEEYLKSVGRYLFV